MENFLQSLFISLIIAFLSYVFKKVKKWHRETHSNSCTVNNDVNPKIIKPQFFISLFVFTVLLIAMCSSKNAYSISLFIVPSSFSFIALWGAFDAAYEYVEKFHQNKEEHISSDTTQNHEQ